MYAVAEKLDPAACQVVARMLYIEMLEAGSTAVGEFHYLHHQPGGAPYSRPTEMAHAVVAAAEDAGISMTMLPVFYERGGFDRELQARQHRFAQTASEFLNYWEQLQNELAAGPTRLGVAPHSLRAVSPEGLQAVLRGIHALDPQAVVHMHVAEQPAEVEATEEHLGARPVAWLLENHDVDERWCFVHATFMNTAEVTALAQSNAVAGVCPTTEANLGDGIFSAQAFLEAGGRFGVGSDSQVSVSGFEELRLLEYGQRLTRGERNVLHSPKRAHVGQRLFEDAVRGGRQALGLPGVGLQAGTSADFVVVDPDHPRLLGHGPETWLDALIFGGAERAVTAVFVGGQQRVFSGRHPDHEAARKALQDLIGA